MNLKDKLVTIPIFSGSLAIGSLKPATNDVFNSYPDCCEQLSIWRNDNAQCFTTVIHTNSLNTKKWVNGIIVSDSSVLFLIADKSDKLIGHIGLSGIDFTLSEAELGYVMRGEKHSNPLFMQYAVQALLKFTLNHLEIKRVYLNVFKDNIRAVGLYKRCGFVEQFEKPLVKCQKGETIVWEEVQDSKNKIYERYMLNMEYTDIEKTMKNKDRIYVSGPNITEKEIDYVSLAAKTAWYNNANYFNLEFEKKFAEFVGRKYAAALPSCTAGLHLALMVLGVGEGDEVIVPDITWIATSVPINYVGATPVFVDIDEKNWCISAESIEKSITSKTKAIITVDLYGCMPEYDEILAISKKYNIPVIEDSAEALGSTYKGKKSGAFGAFSVFSFHGSKMLTTGDGGMILTDDEQLYNRVCKLRDHSKIPGGKMFWIEEIGYKYKMSSLQAAFGLAQIERVEELISMKQTVFSWYQPLLSKIDGIIINPIQPYVTSNFWMVSIIWDAEKYSISTQDMIKAFSEYNIDTRPFFYPLSSQPVYEF